MTSNSVRDPGGYYDLPNVPDTQYYLDGGFAIHGTYWHDDFGGDESHGCINVTWTDGRYLFSQTAPTVPDFTLTVPTGQPATDLLILSQRGRIVAGQLVHSWRAMAAASAFERERAHDAPREPLPRTLPGLSSTIPAAFMVLFLVLPLAGLLDPRRRRGQPDGILSKPIVVEALRLSLISTTIVLGFTLAFGSPLALVLARRRGPLISALDTLVDLPIVLPPAVAGLALLLTFGRRGVFGIPLQALGIELPFTTAAVILAGLFVAAPFYIRAARSGFLAVPREIEDAARVEGASNWQLFRLVTAPLASPALLGGAVLCWARALGEFGATIMFAGSFQGRTQTMPLAIYAALESDTDAGHRSVGAAAGDQLRAAGGVPPLAARVERRQSLTRERR